jgi:hypothetical protein
MKSDLNETVNILLGFGGSGGKTVAHLMELMANDPEAARVASQRVHIVLCDTDDGDLEVSRDLIQKAFAETGLSDPPKISVFRLADSVDLFQDLVSERMRPMTPEGKATIRQFWWFEPTRDGQGDRPFSAATMPENVNRGAAQCPLVSHFLAWDKLPEFERVLEGIATHCKNTLNLENFSIDLFVIAGLAGGTGRGSWQSLALKAREYFWQDKNGRRACRPIGFFFDWSCFRDVAAQRPEQAIKLQVNSYTGLSELAMWLRSALPADGIIANQDAGMARERAFMLPSLRAPADRSAAAIDTERYMPEDDEARLGRTPIHRAYVFTDTSRSMSVQSKDDAYRLAAAAIYGRLCISTTRSADSNEPERACATATSILKVPIARIRLAIIKSANAHRVSQLLHGQMPPDLDGVAGKTLTRLEGTRGAVVVEDEGLSAKIRSEARGIERLLAIGAADTFAALGGLSQMDPGNPMCVIAFAVSRAGDESVLGQVENGESRQSVIEEIRRAVASVQSIAPAAVETAFKAIAKSEDGRAVGEVVGLNPAQQRARIRQAVTSSRVIEPVIGALGDGIGPARAMIAGLRSAASAALIGIQRAVSSGTESGGTRDPSQWAAGYFGWMGGFRRTQLDAFRGQVRQALCEAAHSAVARELKVMAEFLLEDMQAIEKMLEDAVVALEAARSEVSRQSEALRGECFTTLSPTKERLDDQNKMLKRMQDERGQPVTKMIRQLRPVYDKATFEEQVDRLARDTKTVQAARVSLTSFLEQRLKSSERRTERSAYEFRASLEEHLNALLDRQSVDFRDLRDYYSVERVLDGLSSAWFETFKERKSDASWAMAFSREVESLTGYDLVRQFDRENERATGRPQSEDDLRPLSGEDLLCRAALRLASGCDPFVQYTATGDRRDRATLIMPNSPVAERAKRYTKSVEQMARDSGNFAHVKAVESKDNYFMVVATADLPKVNFANTAWDGWFSEPSDPAVRKWLDWCEDEQGIAPFKTADGSVGLGYICPKYVRDPHLSARRWKPWVKNDRNREQMHRKWVALAYGLVGNTWYRTRVESEWGSRYEQFVSVFGRTFGHAVTGGAGHEPPNADFPGELWTLPLIEEREGGRGPTFLRRSWVSTAQGIRLAGLDPKDLEDVTSSMRKFVNWFDGEESDRAVGAVLVEQAIFANRLRRSRDTNDQVHAVTSVQHVEAIRKFLREYASQWQSAIRDVKGLASEERDRQVEFLDRFMRFFDSGMPDLNLLEPFDGTRL